MSPLYNDLYVLENWPNQRTQRQMKPVYRNTKEAKNVQINLTQSVQNPHEESFRASQESRIVFELMEKSPQWQVRSVSA